jgi:putative ABC transport system permease protein
MLACEGSVTALLGVVAGTLVGSAISLVLVHVVNRQSFHWGMELHVPWGVLAALGAGVVVLATATAVAGGRQAMSGDVIRAVREDW